HVAPLRGFFGGSALTDPSHPRTMSIARRDSQALTSLPLLLCRCLRSGELQDLLLRFPHIFERELAGLNQLRHHGFGPSTEQRQQVVNEFTPRVVARYRSGEN